MQRLFIFGLLLILLTACGESEPRFTDNGNPGQIKVIVFFDDNRNATMDSGEAGVPAEATITQEISCPPTGTPTYFETDSNGTYVFEELKPGKYCVFINSQYQVVTKLTHEVYVSSDAITEVAFGVAR